jgi:hypothetical protein
VTLQACDPDFINVVARLPSAEWSDEAFQRAGDRQRDNRRHAIRPAAMGHFGEQTKELGERYILATEQISLARSSALGR